MAHLVFVHGVATRENNDYKVAALNREKLFRELLFDGHQLSISTPTWGKFIRPISPNVFATNDGVAAFALSGIKLSGGGEIQKAGLFGTNRTDDNEPDANLLARSAAYDAGAALDAVFIELMDRAALEQRELEEADLAALRKAVRIIEDGTAGAAFEGNISVNLTEGGPQSMGLVSTVSRAVKAASDRIRNAASTVAFGAVRDRLSPAAGMFLGDVFAYLKDGDARRAIRSEIASKLVDAHLAAQQSGGPLVVIGHSLGGVILIDMLSDPVDPAVPEGLRIDALVTVGSQPGLFADLGVIGKQIKNGDTRQRPASVAYWLNVFDPIDPLAFRADPIFDGVTDLSFNSVTGVLSAHSNYFHRPQFYARCRNRLKENKIL